MKIKLLAISALISFVAVACGQQTSSLYEDNDSENSVNNKQRVTFTKVNFSKWVDMVVMEGVLTPPASEDDTFCTIAEPTRNHETVRWAPMQTFWVHLEDHDDMVDSYDDIYFDGDSASKDNYEGAVGIRQLSTMNKKFFSIKSVSLSDDKKELNATMSIPLGASGSSSFDLRFHVSTKYEDGVCTPIVKDTGSGENFTDVDIKQNFLGFVKEVTLR